MKNYKKGFTLIEVIVVLSIVFLLLTNSLVFVKTYKKLLVKNEVETFQVQLVNFINNSRFYCKKNNKSGYLTFNGHKGTIRFFNDEKLINMLHTPRNIKELNARGIITLNIDNFGYTSDSCSIFFKDSFGNEHKITICVGSGYSNIKY